MFWIFLAYGPIPLNNFLLLIITNPRRKVGAEPQEPGRGASCPIRDVPASNT